MPKVAMEAAREHRSGNLEPGGRLNLTSPHSHPHVPLIAAPSSATRFC